MTVLVPAKPWWQSKTLWLNALVILAGLLEVVRESGQLLPATAAWVGVGLAGVNLILRTLTTQPVAAGANRVKPVDPA